MYNVIMLLQPLLCLYLCVLVFGCVFYFHLLKCLFAHITLYIYYVCTWEILEPDKPNSIMGLF